jgi:hypothetical protein
MSGVGFLTIGRMMQSVFHKTLFFRASETSWISGMGTGSVCPGMTSTALVSSTLFSLLEEDMTTWGIQLSAKDKTIMSCK